MTESTSDYKSFLHLNKIPVNYTKVFSKEELYRHYTIFKKICPSHPFEITLHMSKKRWEMLYIGYDIVGLFSFMTGLLAMQEYIILHGHTFSFKIHHQEFSTGSYIALLSFSGTKVHPFPADAEAQFLSLIHYTFTKKYGRLRTREEIREQIMNQLALHIGKKTTKRKPILEKIHINIQQTNDPYTTIQVQSTDSEFFLYCFSHALYLLQCAIHRVSIQTEKQKINDIFWITDRQGRKIVKATLLKQIHFAAILMKQLTTFIQAAPDPMHALQRFSHIIADFAQNNSLHILWDFKNKKDLVFLLGTSDFLWENFIRMNYEHLQILFHKEKKLLSSNPHELSKRLHNQLSTVANYKEKKKIINQFKNHETYLIDIDHILQKEFDFFFLSKRLTFLAELIIQTMAQLTWKEITQKHGTPLTTGGLTVRWTIFGLGKMGGADLGYASDIELLLVYSDLGYTNGSNSVSNKYFFEQFFQLLTTSITAKQKGVFQIDLRLRPYGEYGPIAVRLENFIRYYGREGNAHSIEKLALTRLRPIAGNRTFGKRVLSIRDHLIYHENNISLHEIRNLRLIQIKQNQAITRKNAKFSPGGLVDIEYNVQILQIIYGRERKELRTPRVHLALKRMENINTIDRREIKTLFNTYRFLRSLINALRVHRGNPQDLFLPRKDTEEFNYLARQLRYKNRKALSAADKLYITFETATATVRTFIERHLKMPTIPGKIGGTVVDLLLNNTPSEYQVSIILKNFTSPQKAYGHLRTLAGSGMQRKQFIPLIILAWDTIDKTIDKDLALKNWTSFVKNVKDISSFYSHLLSHPHTLDIFLTILSGSPFLSYVLCQNPEFLDWLSRPDRLTQERKQKDIEKELIKILSNSHIKDLSATIGKIRKRELLRISIRDICLKKDLAMITREISSVARAVISSTLKNIICSMNISWQDYAHRLCILAFGKLGGNELNYSSDIDLLGAYRPHTTNRDELEEESFSLIFQTLIQTLTRFTHQGRAYRVDIRLRPYGHSGKIINTTHKLLAYYQESADVWELQAALKLSPVAGNTQMGNSLVKKIRKIIFQRIKSLGTASIVTEIQKIRNYAIAFYRKPDTIDIKNGTGGIRDIEFLVQILQLAYGNQCQHIVTENTLQALSVLSTASLLSFHHAHTLTHHYILLRHIEHALQVYEDKQLFTLPRNSDHRSRIGKIVMGHHMQITTFDQTVHDHMQRVHTLYTHILGEIIRRTQDYQTS